MTLSLPYMLVFITITGVTYGGHLERWRTIETMHNMHDIIFGFLSITNISIALGLLISNNGKKPAYRPEVKEMAAILFLCKLRVKVSKSRLANKFFEISTLKLP